MLGFARVHQMVPFLGLGGSGGDKVGKYLPQTYLVCYQSTSILLDALRVHCGDNAGWSGKLLFIPGQ
jgi:hypothetical protein